MTISYKFEFNMEVIGKSSPIVAKSRVFYSRKTEDAMEYIRAYCSCKMRKNGWEILTGPLEMTINSFIKLPKTWSKTKKERALNGEILPTGKPDNSNVMKLVEDSMNKIVFLDDARIVDSHQRKRYAEKEYFEVIISEIDGITHDRR